MTMAAAAAVPMPDLNDATFAGLREYIRPSADDLRWQSDVPWRTTFWDAVMEAQATDRPILAWAMNGHPLACT